MTETKKSDAASTLGQAPKLLVEIGPAALFMLSYNLGKGIWGDDTIYWATGIFMAATAASLIYARIAQNRFPPMLAVTFVIVTAFGAMTIYLQDPIFVYIKPTIINGFFCAMILVSFALGFNVWKVLFGAIYEMDEIHWYILGLRWALFFALLAVINEFLWRHIVGGDDVTADMRWFVNGPEFTEQFWVNFRFFGVYPLFFVFVLANVPFTLKHAREAGSDKAKAADQGDAEAST